MKSAAVESKQKGFTLLELTMTLAIMAVILGYTIKEEIETQLAREEEQASERIIAFSQAVAGYLSDNHPTTTTAGQVPVIDGDVFNGYTWLMPAACGGTSPNDIEYLACVFDDTPIPLGLSAPTTTIAVVGGEATASISFGTSNHLGVPTPVSAAGIVRKANESVDFKDGYFISFIAENPNLGGALTGTVDAQVNMSLAATPFLRRDGRDPTTGTLKLGDSIVSSHDNFSLVSKDSTGTQNVSPASSVGSINVNDVYLRAQSVWLSDVVTLALDNYGTSKEAKEMASEAFRWGAVVSDGEIVTKPSCPTGYSPELYFAQANMLPDSDLATPGIQPSEIQAFEGYGTDGGTEWTITLRALITGTGWVNITSTLGYASVFIKCS